MPLETRNKVLIFNSEPIVAELTAFRLQLLDLDPVVLETEEQLDEQLGDCLPSMFIIDLDVTEFDGVHLIEKLSSDEVTSRIPVLCMSAQGDLDRAERAFRAGAREFLVLPYDPVILETKVLRLLAGTQENLATLP